MPPTPRTAATRPRAPLVDALCIAAFFGALYLLLGQKSWYKIDGQITILRLAESGPGHPRHLLADELLRIFLPVSDLFGCTTYEGVRAFSAALGAAAGVVLHRSAAMLGFSRLRCAAAQLALAASPGLVFYATVVEFHAPFLFFASLAFAATTRLGLAARLSWPTALGALACACFSAFAYLQHASGQVLPALLAPWLFVLMRRGGARLPSCLTLAAVLGAMHLALAKGLPVAIRSAGLFERFAPAASDATSFRYITWHLDTLSWSELEHVPTTLLFEWVFPFAVASIAAFFAGPSACAERRIPGARRALALALVPYLAITFLLMRHENEFGAYAIPCSLLACLLAASCTLPRVLMLLSLLALFAGITDVRTVDSQTSGRDFERSCAALGVQDTLIALVASESERDDALMALPNRRFQQYLWLQRDVLAQLGRAQARAWLELQVREGRRLAASPAAMLVLEQVPPLRAMLRDESADELRRGWRWLRLLPD